MKKFKRKSKIAIAAGIILVIIISAAMIVINLESEAAFKINEANVSEMDIYSVDLDQTVSVTDKIDFHQVIVDLNNFSFTQKEILSDVELQGGALLYKVTFFDNSNAQYVYIEVYEFGIAYNGTIYYTDGTDKMSYMYFDEYFDAAIAIS